MLNTINKFKYQAWATSLRFSHQIRQTDDVWATRKGLQDFDFTEYFSIKDWLKNFNNTPLLCFDVVRGKGFRVCAPAHLLSDAIIILGSPVERQRLVIPVGWRQACTRWTTYLTSNRILESRPTIRGPCSIVNQRWHYTQHRDDKNQPTPNLF